MTDQGRMVGVGRAVLAEPAARREPTGPSLSRARLADAQTTGVAAVVRIAERSGELRQEEHAPGPRPWP